jgi:predicted dienelactone hydrolase
MNRVLPLACVLALLGGCSDDTDALFTQGEFDVGYLQTELTYDAAVTGEPRTLPLEVWYPAAAAADAEQAIYRVAGIDQVQVTPADDVFREAPPVSGDFPVVVYSHGSGGVGLLGYPYAQRFASQGWIVVAPDHIGNTALNRLLGGGDPFDTIAVNRPNDVSAVLDFLEAGGVPGADTSRVLVFGHSFGAYTTLAVAGGVVDAEALASRCPEEDPDCISPEVAEALAAGFADPRVDAIVPQAPALVPQLGASLSDITVPTMLQSARLDITTTQEEQAVPAWNGLTGNPDNLWVEVPEGGHQTFISFCEDVIPTVVALLQPSALEDGCGEDFIPIADALPNLVAYTVGFARTHVLGEPGFGDALTTPLADGFVVTTR